MEIWTHLGIEKTKDTNAIIKAYHEKLKLVHPEEKPEEFMALREEFEAAMRYAGQTDEAEETEKTPIDLWIEKVEAVYNELSRRIDISEWKNLLNDDVCQALDSRLDARNALLHSTMDNCALPQNVWQLLDSEFALTENRDALYELFPKDFIDNCVLSGIKNPPAVPYELFAEGTTGNPDCYFRLYSKAREEIRNGNSAGAQATVDDIEKAGIIHPYTDVLKARLALVSDDYDKAIDIIQPLCEKYPDDLGIRNTRADIFYSSNRLDEALSDYDFLLSKGFESSKFIHAKCLMKLGSYIKAKDMLVELWHDYPFEEAIKNAFDEACQKVNEYYEQKYSEGILPAKESIDYAWSCLQSNDLEKAQQIAEKVSTDNPAEKCDFENLCSKLYINLNEPETAIKHTIEWEKAVEVLPEGETDEEHKRKNKLHDIYYVRATAFSMLERNDEALEATARSIELSTERAAECHNLRRVVFHNKKDSLSALHEAEKMVEANPNSWTYYILGVEQFDLYRLQDAFDSFGESLQYSLELNCYIYRIRILCNVGQYDGAQEIMDFLEEHSIQCDALNYCKARILEGRDDNEEALKLYYSIIENIEKGESDIDFGEMVYFRATELDTQKSDEERLRLVNDGLKLKDDCYDLLYLKTTLLENLHRYDEALEVYNKIESEHPGRYHLSTAIGGCYYDMKDYEKALEYYSLDLETRESAGLHDMMGLCLLYLNRPEEATEHFRKAVELDGESVRFRTNLGLAHEHMFDFETAVKIHEENSTLNDSKDSYDQRIYVKRALARAAARAGKYDKAEKAYLKNFEMYSRPDDARFVIEILIESGQLDRALEYIEKFKSENLLSQSQYLQMTADIQRLRGEQKKYFKTISKLPDEYERCKRLGRYFLHNGKYKKAEKYFEKIQKASPNRLDSFTDRLYLLKMLCKQQELDELFDVAIDNVESFDWDNSDMTMYVTKLALINTAAGHPENAKEYIDRALSMPLCEHCRYSKCKDAYVALAEYYEELGEYDKAIETCREGLEIAFDEYDFVYIMERIQKKLGKNHKKENRK